ncbi:MULTISPECIES: TatD family hydrolase [unclassified Coleofasciculus]|uniref:TatD family hydrolase n=1 Tax=unclassified Coleofasciculus TaxID=2692782 RepID=UPI00187EAFA7|nr:MULTISPECIES: TatD family hydrolase [unclassified Coleofasciculus]MBE9127953.1 TatD family hydrolase [Coleofasciculus sp. LEGE 07081]MBE9151112.1 TatD family hydrolase [Coleofasciculus sp. LEGE 07092]
MQLIDTHVHINFDVFQADLEAVRKRWQDVGIVRLVHSCVEPTEFATIQALADQIPELSFAVGLHPLDAQKWESEMANKIESLARSDSRVVAIGETGLDFFKAENHEHQKAVFAAQLAIAKALDLPVIIHCRDAAAPMRDLLQEFWRNHQPVKGVMHCWGGTPEETQWFLDLGFYISFSGIVTFKNAKDIHQSAAMVPSDRLLIETDCPFLSPVPKRGKRNEPAHVYYVAECVARLRDIPLETLARETTQNACRIFGLSLPRKSPQESAEEWVVENKASHRHL